MSPRLPVAAVIALLEKTSCHRIISQTSFKETLTIVEKTLAEKGHALQVESLPGVFSVFSGIPGHGILPAVPLYPAGTRRAEKEDIVMYLLSSGSTSLVPKPLPQRQETVLQWCRSCKSRLALALGCR